jgi:2-polyprenyl-6-hydroxyphenyl methylase/3-demethylubiquinone-9 3-methyltransferase
MDDQAAEVASGQRFEFGKNWSRFLRSLDEDRILEAERSLREMLGREDLRGLSFLDVGSGSGLFSLAAWRLGAEVFSFDFDPQSVACTTELKRRYDARDEAWTIREGSVLDRDFVGSLGRFDVVYSWGVLHHTGAMWEAMGNAVPCVKDGGRLFIAIYNHQGSRTEIWRLIKRFYCSGRAGKIVVAGAMIPAMIGVFAIRDLASLKNPLKRYIEYRKDRGMSFFHDWFDWLGGYPFEAATAAEVVEFYRAKGFSPAKIETTEGSGNNQFVFERSPD